MVVLEGQLVCAVLRHFYPNRGLPYPATLWLVRPQQVLPGVAMEAALAEVFALFVFTLIEQEAV